MKVGSILLFRNPSFEADWGLGIILNELETEVSPVYRVYFPLKNAALLYTKVEILNNTTIINKGRKECME